MAKDNASQALVAMTASIVAAYVSGNTVRPGEVAGVISTVFQSLADLDRQSQPTVQELQPAVAIKRSVTADFIVCLEDGKRLKMLKRHLRTTYNLSPEEYRAKWGLPSNYPMVAPNYAARRSAFAKEIGLGRAPRQQKVSNK